MLYKRSRYDLIRLKAENLTLLVTLCCIKFDFLFYSILDPQKVVALNLLILSKAFMVIQSRTSVIWTDCAEVRAGLLAGVLKSGFESSFLKWFWVPSDYLLNMKPLDSIEPLESIELLVHLDSIRSIDSLVLWIHLAP